VDVTTLGGVSGRARQASKRGACCRTSEWGEVGVGMCVCGCLGVSSDEMVGSCNVLHRNGLNRRVKAIVIGCGSYDLRSSMHAVSERASLLLDHLLEIALKLSHHSSFNAGT
jgi:hypothetical protein